jgi:hypothetical protein
MRAETLLSELDTFEPRDPNEQNELAQILTVLWTYRDIEVELCPDVAKLMRGRVQSLLAGEKHPMRRDAGDF